MAGVLLVVLLVSVSGVCVASSHVGDLSSGSSSESGAAATVDDIILVEEEVVVEADGTSSKKSPSVLMQLPLELSGSSSGGSTETAAKSSHSSQSPSSFSSVSSVSSFLSAISLPSAMDPAMTPGFEHGGGGGTTLVVMPPTIAPVTGNHPYPQNITDIYKGSWQASPNTSVVSMLPFSNSEGSIAFHLVATPRPGQVVQTVQVEMVLRDGYMPTDHDMQTQLEGIYHPPTGSVVLWSFLGDSLVPVQSFSFATLNVTEEEAKIDRTRTGKPLQTRLGYTATSYCFLFARLQMERTKPLEPGEVPSSDGVMLPTYGLLSSDACALHVRINATGLNSERYYIKAMHYTLVISLMSFLQMSFLVKQMEHSSTQANASKVSLLTIGQQGIVDAYLCLLHLFTGVFIEPLFSPFAATAFFEFVLFSLFEMRFLLVCWKARRITGVVEGWDQARRELGMLYTRFYGFLLFGVVLFWLLQNRISILVLIMYSFWWPQIFHNAQHGHRKSLLPAYVIAISLTRLVGPLYVFLCPRNWLRAEQDVGFSLALTAYVALQVVILMMQYWLGPRFFIPRKWIPRAYDYYRPIPTEMHEISPTSGQIEVDCVICMTAVTSAPRSQTAVTPCDHVFHVDCLQQWMQIKMECPTCRRPIPDIVD